MGELGKLNFAVAYAGKRSISGFRTIERPCTRGLKLPTGRLLTQMMSCPLAVNGFSSVSGLGECVGPAESVEIQCYGH